MSRFPPSSRLFARSLLFLILSLSLPCSFAFTDFLAPLLHPCAYNPSAISDLSAALNRSIVGQESAITSTLDLLSDHVANVEHSTKALVLSFHGMTGTGKTYLSTTIASHLFSSFTPSSPSPHAHHFHGMSYHDPLHASTLKASLYSTILRSIESCPLSLFIFEEVHYMHPDVLAHLLPLFSYHARHDHLLLTQAVYVFTSNIGGKAIQKAAFEAEKRSLPRHLIAYPMLTAQITSSFAGQRLLGLLVEHAVVNRYVAFFPLFKTHVKACVQLELEGRRADMVRGGEVYDLSWDASVVAFVASFLQYVGPVSSSGCKGVKDFVTTSVVGEVKKMNRLVDAGWWRRKRWTLDAHRAHLTVRQRQAGEGESIGDDTDGVAMDEVVEVRLEKVDTENERVSRVLANAMNAREAEAAGRLKTAPPPIHPTGGGAPPPVAMPVPVKDAQGKGKVGTAEDRRTGAARPVVPPAPHANQPQAPHATTPAGVASATSKKTEL